MTIEEEIEAFDSQNLLLETFIDELANLDTEEIESRHLFLAESVLFRMFRTYERLTRSVFLHYCTAEATPQGAEVKSKLRCPDWETAEGILKAGNKFLDWGNVVSTKKIADLVFERGFPVSDILAPIHGDLVTLQRFRNFVAHDSLEAEDGFKRARGQYVRPGDDPPISVGNLALYRRTTRSDITLKILHSKIRTLSQLYHAI